VYKGIFIDGRPVYKLTGQSPYLPRAETFGEGGITILRLSTLSVPCPKQKEYKETEIKSIIAFFIVKFLYPMFSMELKSITEAK
jgi:hypothetical protein